MSNFRAETCRKSLNVVKSCRKTLNPGLRRRATLRRQEQAFEQFLLKLSLIPAVLVIKLSLIPAVSARFANLVPNCSRISASRKKVSKLSLFHSERQKLTFTLTDSSVTLRVSAGTAVHGHCAVLHGVLLGWKVCTQGCTVGGTQGGV